MEVIQRGSSSTEVHIYQGMGKHRRLWPLLGWHPGKLFGLALRNIPDPPPAGERVGRSLPEVSPEVPLD